MSWQPIETAPKDGTEILVYGGEICSELGNSSPNLSVVKVSWEAGSNYSEDEDGEYTPKGSWEVVDICYYSITVTNPTDWMPLPNPPEAA